MKRERLKRLLNYALKGKPEGKPEGWWLHHFPGEPISTPDCSFLEEMSPHFQPPLAQLEVLKNTDKI